MASSLPTLTDSDRVHSLIRIRLFLFRLIDHAILGNPFSEGGLAALEAAAARYDFGSTALSKQGQH